MSLTVRNLGSGSSGNALLIDAGEVAVAVDCGIGPWALAAGLRAAGRRLADLDAVLLTHEHVDHVRTVPQVARAGVPLVATAGTARAADLPRVNWEEARLGASLRIGGLTVTALGVSHDAVEPCGYHVAAAEASLTVITDLGCPDAALHDYLAVSDLIVLEANHDVAMLRAGPYPAHLKRRVLSPTGHLSNDDCGRLLVAALGDDARRRTIWLAHLSTTNNRPALARQTVQLALAARGLALPVAPLARYGHEQVWRADDPQEGARPVAVQMPLPLG